MGGKDMRGVVRVFSSASGVFFFFLVVEKKPKSHDPPFSSPPSFGVLGCGELELFCIVNQSFYNRRGSLNRSLSSSLN
jgi:hypothetical protein